MNKAKRFDVGDFLALEQHQFGCHAAGERFCGTRFGNKLAFTPCGPEVYTYRLEFMPKGMGREDYFAQLQAAGWEHCGKVNGWQCLRRAGAAPAEPDGALIHNDLERGRWGRSRAEREALLGVLPMAVCYFAGYLLKDTACAGFLWKLAALFLIVAAAVVLPAYQVRAKCGRVMSRWYQEQREGSQN